MKPGPLVWALAVVVAVAAFLAGRSSAAAPGEGSGEVTFARDMIAHHEQAVDMALRLRDRTSDAELRQIARDIVLTQTSQMGRMQGWLALWGVPLAGREAPMAGMRDAMGMATPQQVQALDTMSAREAEVSFLQLMIRHHQGGVMMARDGLEMMRVPDARRLAESIVNAQLSEIEAMTALLRGRDAEPLPPLPEHGGAHGAGHGN